LEIFVEMSLLGLLTAVTIHESCIVIWLELHHVPLRVTTLPLRHELHHVPLTVTSRRLWQQSRAFRTAQESFQVHALSQLLYNPRA
jgi:hypothetical protein